MGDKITLKLEPREVHGKKVARLRKSGKMPAVVYGASIEPTAVQGDSVEMTKAAAQAGTYTPVHLTIGSRKRITMIKDIDIDPVRNEVRHIAFHAVRENQPVEAEVPIRLVGEGESEAEKAGLIVLQALETLEVKALPLDLPNELEVSIVELAEEGDRITVGDIKIPEGIEIVEHSDGRAEEEGDEERTTILDLVVASVYEPSALQAANEAAGGDAEDESEVESEQGGEAEGDTEATTTDGDSADKE